MIYRAEFNAENKINPRGSFSVMYARIEANDRNEVITILKKRYGKVFNLNIEELGE